MHRVHRLIFVTKTMARIVVTLLLWSSCLIPYSIAAGSEGYFDGRAYAEYLLHRKPVKSTKNTIRLTFQTVQPNGLLLHGDSAGNESGDYFTLELIGGKLRFALSFGRHQGVDDMKNITLGDELADNGFHDVIIEHNGNETWVKLDPNAKGEKHRRIETRYQELHLDDFFFIGGAHDVRRLRDIISGANFKGCLKGVMFNNRNLLQSLGGNATTLRKYGVRDTCPGDVVYSPFTLNGRASQLRTSINLKANELKGRLKFRTYKNTGTILSQKLQNGKGFELTYKAEAVELKVYIKNNPTSVSVRQVFKYRGVDKGMWHDVDFEISAARISITVNTINDHRPPGSDFPDNFFTGSVLVGGDFIGCLWDLTLNDVKFDPTTQKNNPAIQLNVCNIIDFCFPSVCKNFGKCSQDGKNFACDCYGTDYRGTVCQIPKYHRTCYELRQEYPEMETGNFIIDPDGPGPEKPYQTICNITTELDWFGDEISRVWTEVKSMDYNIMLLKYPPEKARKPESVIRDVIYKPSFHSAQTVALASEYCRQFIEYLCTNSKLLNNLNPAYGHWVGSHGRHYYYWGGAGPQHPGKCACGVRGDCLRSNKGCNCDAGLDTLESDEGYLFGANGQTLPVSQVLFGDVDIDNDHYANYTVGSLYCYGRANNTATFRREDGIITLRYREGTLDGDSGYISLYFRTPYDRGILFHQGDKTKNTRDFIRVAITSNDTVTLSFDIGNGPQAITVQVKDNEFNTNRLWHSVHVWHNIKEFGLRVDGIEKTVLNPLQSSKQLDVVGNLYIGGYMKDLMQGFVGCMRGLTINGRIIDLVKFAKDVDYVNPGCEGSCATKNQCQGGARCIDDYNIYRCDCHLTPFYGYFCEKDWGASFKEQQSNLTYTWPTTQADAVGTDFAIGFRTTQCSGTIMTMTSTDSNYNFMISIETSDRLRFSYKSGLRTDGAKEIKPLPGQSFCDNRRHIFLLKRMFDKVVFKVDGGPEIRTEIPRLSRPFKSPKSIVIGATGRDRFEGCISAVKITNWPSMNVKLPTVEPIKWSEYDFTHTDEIRKVGIARDKCGPEPEVPPIPTRPIPGPHGATTPPPGPPAGPVKGRRKTVNGGTIDLAKFAKDVDYVNPGCEGSCATKNQCQGGARCIDDYNIYRCECHLTPFYGYFCEKDWGASFKEQQSYLTYTWPTTQADAVGTDFAIGFRTTQCSGTIMTMTSTDSNYNFMISIETSDRLRFSYKSGLKTDGAKEIKPLPGQSFCDNRRHIFLLKRMFDKIVFKVDGGPEIRTEIPRLSRPFKSPKSIVIGATDRGRFEGCISAVKITNWPSKKVKLPTVEPIKWSEYDFTHTDEIRKIGIAKDKCGPEPEVPPIPTRPIPCPHGATTPPPGPPAGPVKGRRKVGDENTAIIVIVVLLIILVIVAILALLYWYYAKNKGLYHTHEDDDQAKSSEPFIDLQPVASSAAGPGEEPQKKQEWFI